jgi:hypothetical protein
MRPVVYTLSDASGGALTSSVYPPDNYVSPFNVAISVVVTGTVNYTVQYTFDDVFAAGYSASTGAWTDHPSMTGILVTKDSNIAYPVTGTRIKLNSGSGSVRCTFIQAGGGGLA